MNPPRCDDVRQQLLLSASGDGLTPPTPSHLEECLECRGWSETLAEIRAMGTAARRDDLPRTRQAAIREAAMASLGRPHPIWRLRPVAVAAGLALTTVLAALTVQQLRVRIARAGHGPAGKAVLSDPELAALDARIRRLRVTLKRDLERTTPTLEPRPADTGRQASWHGESQRLSRRIQAMTSALAAELEAAGVNDSPPPEPPAIPKDVPPPNKGGKHEDNLGMVPSTPQLCGRAHGSDCSGAAGPALSSRRRSA